MLHLPTLAAVALLVAGPAPSSETTPQTTTAWVARMDGLAGALTSLLADSVTTPADPERSLRLKRAVAAIRALSHGLATSSAMPDADPSVAFLLTALADRTESVARADATALHSNAVALAWTCMACHTRAAHGSGRPFAQLAPVDPALPPDVRGVVYAATRRFEQAEKTFRAAAFDEEFAAKEPLRWERAVKGALMIELRVFHDAPAALTLADRVVNTPGGEALWEDAASWRRVLAVWAKEQRAWPQTAEALNAEAERLIADAQARGPTDAGTEMIHLRATAVVHDLLMKRPPASMRAQALGWLGASYRALKDLDIWSIHLVYDAACVESAPHSKLAAECFARWEDGARAAFTGNGGGALPVELEARRKALASLATAGR